VKVHHWTRRFPIRQRRSGRFAAGQAVIALMRRAKGVTRPEALEVTGWKGISFQIVAKNAGLKLRVESPKGKPYIYRAS
jgi:hypothetical protein